MGTNFNNSEIEKKNEKKMNVILTLQLLYCVLLLCYGCSFSLIEYMPYVGFVSV